MKNAVSIIAGILLMSTAIAQPGDPDISSNATKSIIILVRHAEPVPPPYLDNPPNPTLGENGKERANLLASLLKDTGIQTIYSTDLNRTKETAEPIRALLDLNLSFYGVKDMATIAESMKNNPGIYLVSGHSNTTPDMVKLLGGDPGNPINENEFDRMYVVTIANGITTTVLLRYGKPYHEK